VGGECREERMEKYLLSVHRRKINDDHPELRPHFREGETGAKRNGLRVAALICFWKVTQNALNGVAIKYRYCKDIDLVLL
jgi:hypothetical protein